MLKRGDKQHDIAAHFGVNGGRISEIAKGEKFGSAKPVLESNLPPSGPHLTGKSAHAALSALSLAKEAILKAEHLLNKTSKCNYPH
jgi:hypothetical protein